MINNIDINKPLFKNLQRLCLIKNGTIIDPYKEKEYSSDILIKNGKIEKISKKINEPDADIIDAEGKYISPGFFDMHVHLRDPGNEQSENLITGTNAAMSGGFTGIAAMPNTDPCVDNIFVYESIQKRAERLLVEVYQIPAATKNRDGKVIVEMTELAGMGARAFTDDGSGIQSSETMRGAVTYSSMFNIPILVHAEDDTFGKGVMNESFTSTELGMTGIPNICESSMVARDIEITRYVKGKVHFQHISTKESVELIKNAKKEGLKITAEATPHHFSLTDKEVETFSTDYKMNPPLRTSADVNAVIEGLKDGTIDAIASDHAPHSTEKKNVEFDYAPFGVLGLETLFSASVTYLVRKNKIDMMELLKKIVVNPRKILAVEPNMLEKGQVADLVIFDNKKRWKVKRNELLSLSRNTCFNDQYHYGKVFCTINKNRIYQR